MVSKLPVRRRMFGATLRQRKRKAVELGGRTWLLGVENHKADGSGNEKRRRLAGTRVAEKKTTNERSSVITLQVTGRGSFARRALPGDALIEFWKPDGAGVIEIWPAEPIRHRQKGRFCTTYYLEVFPGNKKRVLTLPAFQQLARSAGVSGRISSNPEICLPEVEARRINEPEMWDSFLRKRRRKH